MDIQSRDRLLQKVCLGLGVAVVAIGLTFCIFCNMQYFGTTMCEGRVIEAIDILTSEGEQHQYITAQYYVDGQAYETQWEESGNLKYEEMSEVELRYRNDNPSDIIEGDWEIIPLGAVLLGIVMIIGAFVLRQSSILQQGRSLSKKERKGQEELRMLKAKVLELVFPFTVGVLFTTFGIVMAALKYGGWAWLFIVFGGVYTAYMGIDLAMDITKYRQYKESSKIKIKVEDTEFK